MVFQLARRLFRWAFRLCRAALNWFGGRRSSPYGAFESAGGERVDPFLRRGYAPEPAPEPKGPRLARPARADISLPTASDAALRSRVDKMARKAALSIFSDLGFGVAPAQFWPYLDRYGLPGAAMGAFLRDLGLSHEKVVERDPEELARAETVMDLLISAGDILESLDRRQREVLSGRLSAGDYETVREAAALAAALASLARLAEQWDDRTVMPAFRALLRSIGDMARAPLGADWAEVAAMDALAHGFALAQARLIEFEQRFEEAVATAKAERLWPHAWRDADHAKSLELDRLRRAIEAARRRLNTSETLSLNDAESEIDRFRAALDALLRLYEEARRTKAGEGRSDHKRHRQQHNRRRRSQDDGGRQKDRSGAGRGRRRDPIETALEFFGFSLAQPPTESDLKRAFRRKMKECHPDIGGSEEEAKQANHFNEVLQQWLAHR